VADADEKDADADEERDEEEAADGGSLGRKVLETINALA